MEILEKVIVIECYQLQKLFNDTYNTNFQIIDEVEVNNDTDYLYEEVGNSNVNWKIEGYNKTYTKMKECIKDNQLIDVHSFEDFLIPLIEDGFLEKGNYIVSVSW